MKQEIQAQPLQNASRRLLRMRKGYRYALERISKTQAFGR
jgi:hypothetical protein